MKRYAVRIAGVLRAMADWLDSEVIIQTDELFVFAFHRSSCEGGWLHQVNLSEARYAVPVWKNMHGHRYSERHPGDTRLILLTVSEVWELLRDDELEVHGVGEVGRRQMMKQWNLIVGGEEKEFNSWGEEIRPTE